MANNTIKFSIKLNVDGKDQIVAATASTRDLKKSLRDIGGASSGLKSLTEAFNQTAFAAKNITDVISPMMSALRTYQSTMANAASLTGKSGSDLRAYRAEAEALASTFGKDMEEVLRAANSMSKGFGVSMDDAMQMLRAGLVSGADANGEFLDTLREYPRYFKEAGLSAEEFVAITANAAKQGVYSDKGVDVIKEGNLRIREMTKATQEALDNIGISADDVQEQLQAGTITTFEVMQRVADKLKELPASSSAVGTAIADIFGGPGEDAGLEYIKSLSSVETNLANVRAAAGETATILDEQVSSTERLRSITLGLTDAFSVLAPIQPFVEMIAQAGMAAISVAALAKAVAGLNLAHKAYVATVGLANAAMVLFSRNAKLSAAASVLLTGSAGRSASIVRVLSAAMTTGAYSATALKIAIKGLLVSTGVGVAIVALTSAIEYFMSSSDEATDKTNELNEAEQAYTSTAAQAQVQMDAETEKLRKLINAHGDTKAAVEHLNSQYGEVFGNHKTASEWYDVLTKKSKIYAKQLGYEAQMKVLSTKLAEKQIQLENNFAKRRELWQQGKAQETNYTSFGVARGTKDTAELTSLKDEARGIIPEIKDLQRQIGIVQNHLNDCAKEVASVTTNGAKMNETLKVSAMNANEVKAAIEKNEKKSAATSDKKELARLKAEHQKLEARKKELEKLRGTDKGSPTKKKPTHYANPVTEEELSVNINYYSKKLNGKDTAEQKQLIANIQGWQKKKDAIELAKKAAEVPTELNSLEAIGKAIEYQNALRQKASKETVAAIDAEIERLNDLKKNYENQDVLSMPDSAVQTYEHVNIKLSYYNDLLNKATKSTRPEIQSHIDALNDIKEGWDKIAEKAREAKKYENLTIKPDTSVDDDDIVKGSIQDKRQSYANAQGKASQVQSDFDNGLTSKADAEAQITAINAELSKLGEGVKPFKLEVDTKEALSGIARFKEKFDTFKEGVDAIDSVKSSVDTLKNSIEEGADAWTIFTNAVNAVSSIFDSLVTVISVVKKLTEGTTAATTTATAATEAQSAANTTEATSAAAAAMGEAGLTTAKASSSAASLPFPANIAAIAAAVAAGLAVVATVASIVGSFATGGIVPGGSTSGDRVLARVNSGEMILNTGQQKRLFDLLNGVGNITSPRLGSSPELALKVPREMSGAAASSVHVSFGQPKWKGRNMVMGLKHEKMVMSKSGFVG